MMNKQDSKEATSLVLALMTPEQREEHIALEKRFAEFFNSLPKRESAAPQGEQS